MKLRLIVPTYRDADRLKGFLPELCDEVSRLDGAGVLVVDDGSGVPWAEDCRKVVADVARQYPGRLEFLALPENQGKGGAVYAGWDASPDCEWLGFIDADGATPAAEAARMIRHAFAHDSEIDVCAGSRIKMMGRSVTRSVKRHLVGRIFSTLSSVIVGLVVYDSQCGCKMLKSSFYSRVRERLVEKRFAFDIDLLANLEREGARITEFPVDWRDIPGSKVSVVRDGLQMFGAILRLRNRLAAVPAAVSNPHAS